jgi:hypothetical protein
MGRTLSSLLALVMLTLFASCGKNPEVLTGVQVQTNHIENDLWLSFQADLNLGNMTFPAVTLPVVHPKTQAQIGQVELAPVLGGKNQIKLGVNISELSDIRSQIGRLPNGNTIPLIANNPTIVVNLGAGAQLYITLAENVTAIGVAVPIRQFDTIGASVGGLNVFPVINIDRVIASAGLFTSRNAGQNGIAIVADVSQYVELQDIYVPSGSGASLMIQAQEAKNVIKLDYSSQQVSSSAKSKIDNMIYDLHKKKTKLKLR